MNGNKQKHWQLQMPLPRYGRLQNPSCRRSHQHRKNRAPEKKQHNESLEKHPLSTRQAYTNTKQSTHKQTARSKSNWAIRYRYTNERQHQDQTINQ